MNYLKNRSGKFHLIFIGFGSVLLLVAVFVNSGYFKKQNVPAPVRSTVVKVEQPPLPKTTPLVVAIKATTSEAKSVAKLATTSVTEKAVIEGERFVVSLTSSSTDKVIDQLVAEGYISTANDFWPPYVAKGSPVILPGGYKLSRDLSPAQIVDVLKAGPYMKWVVIPEGLRKEEIGELLAKIFDWSAFDLLKWNNTYTNLRFDYVEGVYAPNTYLIPIDETPLEVANRLTAKFNEKFSPYLAKFNAQNIKWTTGLTFASIVQREAASKADMPLIAGILWNRLDQNMTLDVDATLQYIRGDVGKGWWAPITVADKQLDSPYNTYKYKGLPPHPISNPGIAAIEAVLNPAETDCLYYLHDSKRATHCAVTYQEHLDNIEKHLKN